MNTINIKAYGTEAKDAQLKQMNIERRDTTAKDIEIEIRIRIKKLDYLLKKSFLIRKIKKNYIFFC